MSHNNQAIYPPLQNNQRLLYNQTRCLSVACLLATVFCPSLVFSDDEAMTMADETETRRDQNLYLFLSSSPPNALTESLIMGQMCSSRHIHSDVGSHGLLESTIYKRCHESGPPSRGAARTFLQRKGRTNIISSSSQLDQSGFET